MTQDEAISNFIADFETHGCKTLLDVAQVCELNARGAEGPLGENNIRELLETNLLELSYMYISNGVYIARTEKSLDTGSATTEDQVPNIKNLYFHGYLLTSVLRFFIAAKELSDYITVKNGLENAAINIIGHYHGKALSDYITVKNGLENAAKDIIERYHDEEQYLQECLQKLYENDVPKPNITAIIAILKATFDDVGEKIGARISSIFVEPIILSHRLQLQTLRGKTLDGGADGPV